MPDPNNNMNSLNNPKFRLKKLSAGFNKIQVRIPFQPRDISMKEYAHPKELMINYVNGDAYVKSEDGTEDIAIFNDELILNMINKLLEALIENASDKYDTLKKIEDVSKKVLLWYKEITENDPSDRAIKTYEEILNFFSNLNETHNIKELLNSKVNKEEGKGLSNLDFTNELKNKLDGIEEGANNYKHPTDKFCNFKELVDGTLPPLIDNGNGSWTFDYKRVPGLENLTPDTKNYEHPEYKVCSENFPIKTINGRSGDIILTKEDFGYINIENKKLSTMCNDSNYSIKGINSFEEFKKYFKNSSYNGIFGDLGNFSVRRIRNGLNGYGSELLDAVFCSEPDNTINCDNYISFNGFKILIFLYAVFKGYPFPQTQYVGSDKLTNQTVPPKKDTDYKEEVIY